MGEFETIEETLSRLPRQETTPGPKITTRQNTSPQDDEWGEPVKCHSCNDAGVVHPRVKGRIDYARTVPCRDCAPPERVKKFLGVSSLGNTFAALRDVTGIFEARDVAIALAGGSASWHLLMIYGSWGSGKTHLLEAICLTLYNQGLPVNVLTFPALIGRLKSTFASERREGCPTFEDVMADLCKRPYLLLDDVGAAGSFTPWSLEQLERIILDRDRDHLTTVLTSNLSLERLPPFIVSRFSDPEKGRIVLNAAPDYRRRKA